MKKVTALALVAVAMLASANARADLIELSATSNDTRWSDFDLIFNDVNGDGLFEWSELVSFSGITILGDLYSFLGVVPDAAGVSLYSQDPLNSIPPPGFWGFCTIDPCIAGIRIEADGFAYTLTRVSEPGTLALLGLGLAAIGFGRRRRKAA